MSTETTMANRIKMFMHCKMCLDEFYSTTSDMSPRDYAQIEVGWTDEGFQVWCKRHEANIMDVDFEGAGPFIADMRL
jgi:hypothetical protein